MKYFFQAVYHVLGVPIWWERQNPRTILQPGSAPGQCWAFKGSEGCVVIKLSNPVFISNITLEHIAKNLSPDRQGLFYLNGFQTQLKMIEI